jgi:lipopolysaccharide export LptBFGC system permease protein LptF
MNFRIAYGLSCALLVAMGAALGLISRGGQFLTAFAISVVPAAGIIVMILMGKRMISNPSSSTMGGYIAIWGGMAVLLVADVIIYCRLGKR